MSKRGGQGRKEREKSIRRLRQRIVDHVRKIEERPNDPARPHWEGELATFRDQLLKYMRRLGRD